MSLRDDLDQAVRAAGGPRNAGLLGDGTWGTVVPVGGDRLLPVQARLARSGHRLSLVAALAHLHTPDPEVLAALLGRHVEADRTDGVAYGLVSEEDGDLVVGVLHWVLASITPEQFRDLLRTFTRAVADLRADLEDMIALGAPLELIPASTLDEVLGEQG